MVALAREFGTPLYIFDETTLRAKCQEFRHEFGSRYSHSLVIYACKAFFQRTLARLLDEEGLGLDVVSAGELALARAADFPLDRVYFHGNNKSAQELEMASAWGVGRVVVDNFYELALLQEIAQRRKKVQDILLRLTPGIDPHTHQFITTGTVDSKFGFPGEQWEKALSLALASPALNLLGFHFHLGSSIYEMEPYQKALDVVLAFAEDMRRRHGFKIRELSTGGGFAITYTRDRPTPAIAAYAQAITSSLLGNLHGMEPPRLILEPGRAIVGQAGVALYQVGARKDIPGVRSYVSLDGGMADNIRPALYGARYEAVVANRMDAQGVERVTLAGKFCESGDILIQDIDLPPLKPGDLIAIPASGAYAPAMASNYNASLRPAFIMVSQGQARLIQRRETFDDLMAREVS